MINEYDFYEAPEDYEPEWQPDKYFVNAQEEIRNLFETNRDSIFYIRQLQVKFEKKYFHWITNNAILGLHKIGYLKDYRIKRGRGASTRYFIQRSNRYPIRGINKIQKVVEAYSQDHITRSCGHRAEDLFCKALAMHKFMPMEEKVKEYNGRKWTQTGHDLDFIFSRDGVEYGCEIKNTLGYIGKEEMDIKLAMCAHFGVKPLFIMRYAPKTYIDKIINEGGFALIFETQIYELSQKELVEEIKAVVGLPVICTAAIPDGIIKRFENWHIKNIL